ncbi:MAG: Hsp20/alpha crystallin family protein [Truepera sp.]|nr:Hsp20/alpha crystallin family protein [Truepera sp.]
MELGLNTDSELKELLVLRDRIDQLSHELSGGSAVDSQPKLDLLDVGDAYRVVIEVPGVPQDRLEVALHEHELTIAGVRDPYDESPLLLLSERPSGRFQRTIMLPGEVEREASHAHLKEGLLTLHLPKKA